MNILVTNDDGINSKGLRILAETLKKLGVVFIVAPDRQRSGVGLSITLDRPLRCERLDKRVFSVNGMPTDCVELAVYKLMETPPDLIVSGINDGQNIGYDIYHSGTVGAAITGTMFGIPSMAVSISIEGSKTGEVWYDSAAQITLALASLILDRKLPNGTLLNVNVPNMPLFEIDGIEVTRHCNATYDIEIHNRLDPRGKEYYWVGGVFQKCNDRSNTDLEALNNGRVSVTPLRLDLTDYIMMRELPSWIKDIDLEVDL
ncbi:MAG: 5'/3'-nucleotidase SurE [bacterium]